jgi:hypothetical protein
VRAPAALCRIRCAKLTLALTAVLLLCCSASRAASAPAKPEQLFVRVSLLSPSERPWRVQIIVQKPGAKPQSVFAGKTIANTANEADLLPARQPGSWVDLSGALSPGGATVRFLFDTQPALEQQSGGVKATIDVAAAADDAAILRSVTDHDPGNVIAIRIPADPRKGPDRILSIREDTQRRLDEVKSLHLPDGPRPRKIWCMTGFRSNGEFYTDPAIAEMDFEIVRRLGMNGFWQQSGGQPGELRKMAEAHGLDRSTVYWRSVETLPADKDLGGATRLDWNALDLYLDKVYRDSIAATRKQHPGGMPEVVADLMDEPDGLHFDGPEYREAFARYARQQGLSPQLFGRGAWEQVAPLILRWRSFFEQRAQLDRHDEPARRLFYWSAKFWNYVTARTYATATRKVEQYAPATGTRVNFGPPWWYDYGTLPRGIDAFEFGRLRSVTMGFNEDWVGHGNPRVPLEIDTLLMDWSRAAARPATPLLGCYVTRDADRPSVKLRTFACLAREAKIFDFYYYGPAYTFFDHWSDNSSMVQGVAELTRDIGAADDVLWDGRAPKAETALLYSQSWPVWKTDDTEQCEQVMAYLALLHAGVPVDIVSDTEVADGRFAARGYKCLYVVNESVPAAAAAEVERWVHAGGRLWASGWAAMADEYNAPSDRWDKMLGIKSRQWKPTGDLKRLGQPIRPDDWTRPIFGREVTIDPADDAAAQPIELPGQTHKAFQRSWGKGLVQVVPWTAGKEYMDGATEKAGSLAKATIFPEDGRRKIFAGFAADAGTSPPATTSVSQVLAWPLWTQSKGVILLANYTGEPVSELHVRLAAPFPVTRAHSLREGDLPLSRSDPEHVELTLPMRDVTDIIELK